MGFKIVGDQIRALQKSIGLAPHALAYRQSDDLYRHTTPEELAELANQHIDTFPFTPAKFKLFLARAAWKSNGFREAYVRTGEVYPPATFGQVVGEEEYRDFGAWLFDNQLVDDGEIFVKNPEKIRDFEYVWLGLYWRCNNDGWFDKRALAPYLAILCREGLPTGPAPNQDRRLSDGITRRQYCEQSEPRQFLQGHRAEEPYLVHYRCADRVPLPQLRAAAGH